MFHEIFQEYSVSFIVTQEHGVKRTSMTAPRMVIEHRFINLIQDVASRQEPIKIKLARSEPVWSRFDNCTYDREYGIEFANDAWKTKYGEL